MKVFENLTDYNSVAKVGDIITLQGNGFVCGLRASAKTDCYTVKKLNGKDKFVSFTQYKGRTLFTVNQDQKLGLIDKKTYSKLPIY